MKINWKVRMKNPYFWIGLIGVVLTASGTAPETLTTWGAVVEWGKALVSNPFALCGVVLAVFGSIYDPTTKGVTDSDQALTYTSPGMAEDDLSEVYTDDRRDDEDK